MRINPPENKVLAIFGLDRDCEDTDIMKVFKKYGATDCKLIIDKRVRHVLMGPGHKIVKKIR